MRVEVAIIGLTVMSFGCRSEEGIKVYNTLPVAEITSHSDGSSFVEGESISFVASVSDANHDTQDLLLAWFSGTDEICAEIDAPPDGIVQCLVEAQSGWEDIRVQVTDPAGGGGSDLISISVQNNVTPEVQIIEPLVNGVYYSDQSITFSGVATDQEDAPESLISIWSSEQDGELSIDATPNSNGEFSGSGLLTAGEHFLTLTTEDTNGKVGSDAVSIIVGPPNTAPMCNIVAPQDDAAGTENESVRFEGTASDVDIPSEQLFVAWSSDKDGLIGSSSPSSSGEVVFVFDQLSVNAHTITMTVSDEVGATCADFIVYTVGTAPEITLTSPLDGSLYDEGAPITFRAEIEDNEDQPNDVGLQWVSSLDGIFSTQSSSSSGVAQFVDSQLSNGVHSITLTATDTDGLYSDAVFVLTINALPSAPLVSILPDPAYTLDNLSAAASGSLDADGQAVSYSYLWYKNGVSQGITGNTLPSAQTSRGDSWTVRVTPNDGISDGPYTEVGMVIANSLPVVGAVSITPPAPSTLDTLMCSASSSDADLDAVTLDYAWYKNGQLQTSSLSTLSGPFQQNDVLTCRVTPNDGYDFGVYLESSVTIANSPPVVAAVAIAPLILYTDTLVTATVSASDPDGDPLSHTFEWYVDDGSGFQSVQTTTTIGFTDTLDGFSYFDRDDDVYVSVVTSDGSSTDSMTSSSMIVNNTPPSAFNVLVIPAAPIAGQDDILCLAQSSDADMDGVTFTYAWTVDGVPSTVATDTVSATDIADGEVWVCTLTPNDGTDDGSSVSVVAVVGSDNAAAVGSNTCSAAGLSSNTSHTLVSCLADESMVNGNVVNSSYVMQLGSVYRVQPSN